MCERCQLSSRTAFALNSCRVCLLTVADTRLSSCSFLFLFFFLSFLFFFSFFFFFFLGATRDFALCSKNNDPIKILILGAGECGKVSQCCGFTNSLLVARACAHVKLLCVCDAFAGAVDASLRIISSSFFFSVSPLNNRSNHHRIRYLRLVFLSFLVFLVTVYDLEADQDYSWRAV